jgi:hypothetical protein
MKTRYAEHKLALLTLRLMLTFCAASLVVCWIRVQYDQRLERADWIRVFS